MIRTRPMWHRTATAFVVVASLSISGLIAGCSSSDTRETSQGAGNADVATGGEQFGTADAETAKLGSDAAPGVFPRTVKHANGVAEIPRKPERVVVLDTGELDDVLALGIRPVGLATTDGTNPIPSYLADQVRGVPTIGETSALKIEEIAKLKPDLILGSKLRADKLYAQLNAIAPTVFSIRPGFPWKENFRLVGDAVGDETKVIDQLNNYTKNAKALGNRFTGAKPTVSMLRFMPNRIRLYGNKSMIGVVLKDAGLPRPPRQNVDELAVEISLENLPEAAGDYIFHASYGKPELTGESAALASPAWSQLAAVKDGTARRVDDDIWFLGLGPTGANLVVKQLGEYLAR